MSEKRKPKIYEGCDKWRIYEYMDIIDYEHCRFCHYYSENDDFERFECDNLDRYEGDYCFTFDEWKYPIYKFTKKLSNVKPCSCGNDEILFVKHKPWFFNTYYIKCPKCETKTKRSWFRSWAFKRWRKLNEIQN